MLLPYWMKNLNIYITQMYRHFNDMLMQIITIQSHSSKQTLTVAKIVHHGASNAKVVGLMPTE